MAECVALRDEMISIRRGRVLRSGEKKSPLKRQGRRTTRTGPTGRCRAPIPGVSNEPARPPTAYRSTAEASALIDRCHAYPVMTYSTVNVDYLWVFPVSEKLMVRHA